MEDKIPSKIVVEAKVYAQVLGIAQDAGYPQIGCTKNCCKRIIAGIQTPEKVSCIGLVDKTVDKSWLLDATPDFVEQWNQLSVKEQTTIAGVLPTHAHIGHYTGLMYLGRESLGADKLPVYVMPRMDSFLRTNGPWSQLIELENIELFPLLNETPLVLSSQITIAPIEVLHRDEFSETVAFLVTGPQKKLLYLPDIDKWEKWDETIESWIAKVDYAFLDGTFFDGKELPNRDMSEIPHPFIVESIERFKTLPQKEKAKIYFIHFNHTNPVLEEGSAAQELIKKEGFNIAFEGLQIPL